MLLTVKHAHDLLFKSLVVEADSVLESLVDSSTSVKIRIIRIIVLKKGKLSFHVFCKQHTFIYLAAVLSPQNSCGQAAPPSYNGLEIIGAQQLLSISNVWAVRHALLALGAAMFQLDHINVPTDKCFDPQCVLRNTVKIDQEYKINY